MVGEFSPEFAIHEGEVWEVKWYDSAIDRYVVCNDNYHYSLTVVEEDLEPAFIS